MNRIFVFELAGKNAISMQNGDKLYKSIHPHLLAGDSIAIDFNGVSLFASPFFNASIALLLKDCLLYTSPSPRDGLLSRMPSSA